MNPQALAALALLPAVMAAATIAGRSLRRREREHHEDRCRAHDAAAATRHPAPEEAADPPVTPTAAPAPGPAFTPAELRKLTQIDGWAEQLEQREPLRVANATKLADGFRRDFGHLADDDLGRLLLACSAVARDYGLAGMPGRLPGTLALAAAHLTRLTRTDVTIP